MADWTPIDHSVRTDTVGITDRNELTFDPLDHPPTDAPLNGAARRVTMSLLRCHKCA